jgi:hypothetical protein
MVASRRRGRRPPPSHILPTRMAASGLCWPVTCATCRSERSQREMKHEHEPYAALQSFHSSDPPDRSRPFMARTGPKSFSRLSCRSYRTLLRYRWPTAVCKDPAHAPTASQLKTPEDSYVYSNDHHFLLFAVLPSFHLFPCAVPSPATGLMRTTNSNSY